MVLYYFSEEIREVENALMEREHRKVLFEKKNQFYGFNISLQIYEGTHFN